MADTQRLRVLLNQISDELTTENLQSLMLIYRVNERTREKIEKNEDRCALFHHMMKVDFIGDEPEQLRNLYILMRRMKPKNLDLVRRVAQYINKKFNTNDVCEVIGHLSESIKSPSNESNERQSESSELEPDRKDAFTLSCTYVKLVCRKVPSLWWLFTALLVGALIVTSVVCFDDGKEAVEKIKSGHNLKCLIILSVEILILGTMIGVRCWQKKYCRRAGYQQFANANGVESVLPVQIQDPVGNGGTSSIPIAHRSRRISEGSECCTASVHGSAFSRPSLHKAGSASSFVTIPEQQRGEMDDKAYQPLVSAIGETLTEVSYEESLG